MVSWRINWILRCCGSKLESCGTWEYLGLGARIRQEPKPLQPVGSAENEGEGHSIFDIFRRRVEATV